jgi:hypothetical protein
MAKNKTINTSYDLGYSARNENHNTIRDIRINFENPDDDAAVIDNLNTFLAAVGLKIRVSAID